jgi:voltage-gated potassium channel
MGDRGELLERRLEWPMLVVAALVVPALILEGSDVGDAWKSVANVLNWIIWLAFLGELVAMLAVVRDRSRYLRHHMLNVGIVLLTPPFLPALLQSLRALRLLRLTRVMRLARLLRLAPIFRLAFTLRGFRYTSAFAGLVVLTGAAAFQSAEPGKNYFDGIYWAITTMTTVGYGDELPTTIEGKCVSMSLMLVGIGYFAVVTGAIADRFIVRGAEAHVEAVEAEASDDDLGAQVDRLAVRASELVTELEALRLAVRGATATERRET